MREAARALAIAALVALAPVILAGVAQPSEDQARQAVLLVLSPRFCGRGLPWATVPSRVSWALRAGTKQL